MFTASYHSSRKINNTIRSENRFFNVRMIQDFIVYGDAALGGLVMSVDGGLEEVDESRGMLAIRSSSASIFARNGAVTTTINPWVSASVNSLGSVSLLTP